MKSQKFYYTKYFCPQTLQVLITADFAGLKLESTEINKKYDSVSLVTAKGVLNRTNSILRYIAAGTNLIGANQSERNQLNTWFEFFNNEINPLLTELYGQVFGQKPPVETKYTYCLTEIHKNLKVLDDCLKIKTFFVGNNISIFDITLVCYFQNLFKLIVNEAERKKLTNLLRWYSYVRQIPLFTKYLGKPNLCGKQSFKVDFKTQDNVEKIEKKQQQTQKEQPKKQNKKKQSKPELKEQDNTEKTQQNAEGTFKLDDFKREFQNSPNQAEVLKKLLDTFDQERLSVWKIHYLKDVTEGKVLYLTQNLANGSLQRIDQIRKTAFGSWGVYGQEGNFQIRGVMVWQGVEIDKAWKQHPAYEYHQFTKLSPQKEQDCQIICDYILERQCAEGLMIRSTKRVI